MGCISLHNPLSSTPNSSIGLCPVVLGRKLIILAQERASESSFTRIFLCSHASPSSTSFPQADLYSGCHGKNLPYITMSKVSSLCSYMENWIRKLFQLRISMCMYVWCYYFWGVLISQTSTLILVKPQLCQCQCQRTVTISSLLHGEVTG